MATACHGNSVERTIRPPPNCCRMRPTPIRSMLCPMSDIIRIASVAALLGDPARANILTTLMDGRALTVSELAGAAGVTIQTASGHLAKLEAAQLLCAEKQGRHRYFRLSGPDVAHVLEALMGLAQRTGATRVRTGPKDAALRTARICYDHIAGASGV